MEKRYNVNATKISRVNFKVNADSEKSAIKICEDFLENFDSFSVSDDQEIIFEVIDNIPKYKSNDNCSNCPFLEYYQDNE